MCIVRVRCRSIVPVVLCELRSSSSNRSSRLFRSNPALTMNSWYEATIPKIVQSRSLFSSGIFSRSIEEFFYIMFYFPAVYEAHYTCCVHVQETQNEITYVSNVIFVYNTPGRVMLVAWNGNAYYLGSNSNTFIGIIILFVHVSVNCI